MIPPPLRRLLDSDERGGVFFLHGDEEFQKEAAARALVEAHLDPATADFNLDRLRGSEVEAEQLASLLATPPMMAEWRVVVLQETQAVAGNPALRTTLLDVAKAPPPGLALILLATIPDRSRAKVYSELRRLGWSLEFQAVSPDDAPGWLMAHARERFQREMEPEAAVAVVAALGPDLGMLSAEVEKLASVAQDGEPITLEVARRAGTHIPRADRWTFFQKVGERRFMEAVEDLPALLSQGESGVGLVIGLATQLLRIGLLVEGGTAALEKALPPHQGWLARKLGPQARGWSGVEVEEALLELWEVDRMLKSGRLGDEHLLEGWLLSRRVRERAA